MYLKPVDNIILVSSFTDALSPTIRIIRSYNTDLGKPYATVKWAEPLVADNSGTFTTTVDYDSGYRFPIGTTFVTYTAVDPAGNLAVSSFGVEVKG